MTAPRGKGIYARDPDWYPDANPALYAAMMGCQFIGFLHHATSDEQIAQARSYGLEPYLWQGPFWWKPDNWAATLDSQAERCLRLGLPGFIADVEHAPLWRGKRTMREQLGQRLADASFALPSVGFTSFPSWYVQDIMPPGSNVWGSPQLYGRVSPGTPLELKHRGERWQPYFQQLVPSLAAWGMDAAEQADYLKVFGDERGAIFWQVARGAGIEPEVGTELFEVLRRFEPGLGGRMIAAFIQRATHPWPFARFRV